MPDSVLLLHIPPGAQPHLDWLLPHADAGPNHPLITFRLARLPSDLPPNTPIPAVRIPDHRPHYLTYEGPLTDNRGLVRRLASPSVTTHEDSPDRLRFTADWGQGPTLWLASRTPNTGPSAAPDAWTLTRLPSP